MANGFPGFSGLKISNYYKYILYVAGVILIVSLFFEAKGVSNQWLRHVAFWTIIAGLLIWFIDVFFNFIEAYMIHSKSFSENEFLFWDTVIFIVFFIIQIIVWIAVFFMITNR